jgi:hypothetical protein
MVDLVWEAILDEGHAMPLQEADTGLYRYLSGLQRGGALIPLPLALQLEQRWKEHVADVA